VKSVRLSKPVLHENTGLPKQKKLLLSRERHREKRKVKQK